MEDVNPLINNSEQTYKDFQEILRGFLTPDTNGNVFNYGTPLMGLVSDYSITNDAFESDPPENELKVIPYDIEREIYQEINHGFLIKETDHGLFCIGKLVDDLAVELSYSDKKICDTLEIIYRK